MRRFFYIGMLLSLAIILGFYQEQLKISINYILENAPAIQGFYNLDEAQKQSAIEARRLHAPFDYYHNHKTLTWLYYFGERELVSLKWAVTLLSLATFFALNAALSWLIQRDKIILRWLALGYGFFILVAFGIFLLGKVLSVPEESYAISRRITGALQSLVPLMIIGPMVWFYKDFRKV